MTSVRLRLLVLALAPFTVLMPFMLLLGMTRWTADYDALLIANVESDLRIAEQYLSRLMNETRDDLTGLAESQDFARVAASEAGVPVSYLLERQHALGLDFLHVLTGAEARTAAARWPVLADALLGRAGTAIDIFDAATLGALPGSLAGRARIELIPTEAAVPTDRETEDRGMVVHSAAPVQVNGQKGVLVGGILLNRNLEFIDRVNALVYLNAVTGGDRQGTATLFLDDVRISTNVRLFEDVRALGTRVSAVVRNVVLGDGQTWLARAFVVNDWYISGYLPLTDSFGARVGMLYVGYLEAPYTAEKRAAYLWMLGAFTTVVLLSVPVFLGQARSIFAPLERMTQTLRKVGEGDLSARNGAVGRRDEIGQVAGHLDDLLDQVQDRDARLRAWADELNQRVEDRTAELREANARLEETFRQLVMSEKLASIGEITAGVAHEINNPVAVIQGNVDVIRMALGDGAAEVRTELDLIDRQVARIGEIVGKLLQFARPDEYSAETERVDPVPLVKDCLVLVDHLLSRTEIVTLTRFGAVPPVRIPAGELQQVVINLVTNAVQAMGRDGQLALSLRNAQRDGVNGVVLVVADSGPGLSDAVLERLFDPFFTTKRGEGTGLGLSISQTLIQRAGGLITARNRPSGGAEFHVWLPTDDEG